MANRRLPVRKIRPKFSGYLKLNPIRETCIK